MATVTRRNPTGLDAAVDDCKHTIEHIEPTTGDYVCLTYKDIDIEALNLRARSHKAGAVSTFLGTTRDNFHGKGVVSLEYEAFAEMAIKYLQEIAIEIRKKWTVEHIVMAHKLGSCPAGDVSVLITVSSAHRKEALESVEFAIYELKRLVPIWKKEQYDDKTNNWKSNAEYTSVGSGCAGGEGDGEAPPLPQAPKASSIESVKSKIIGKGKNLKDVRIHTPCIGQQSIQPCVVCSQMIRYQCKGCNKFLCFGNDYDTTPSCWEQYHCSESLQDHVKVVCN
jgi:molybdopterin synthase catalytic subunit